MKRRAILIIAAILVICVALVLTITDSQKITLDPFDYVTISFKGKNGDGQAELQTLPPDAASGILLNKISYELSDTHQLSEGDQIVISASSEDYKLTQTQKNITVEGLSIPITDITVISPEARDVIHAQSESSLRSTYTDVANKVQSIDYTPVGMYLVSANANENRLYDAMRMDITFNDGSTASYYGAAVYRDIIVSDTQPPTISYSLITGLNGNVQRIASDTQTVTHTFIFLNRDAVKSEAATSMEGNYTEIEFDE